MSSPSYLIVKRKGGTNANNEPGSGRSVEVTTYEIIEKKHKILSEDCRLKFPEIRRL